MVEHRWARDIIGVPTMAVLYEYVELWEAPENVSLQPSAGSSGSGRNPGNTQRCRLTAPSLEERFFWGPRSCGRLVCH
jgi:hypothetical protein